MLKKDLIKKINELQKHEREVVKSFFEALRLINKNDMKMEISPAVREFCAYDIRVAKSKKPIKWKTYGGARMWEYRGEMGWPPKRFLEALKRLIKEVKRYEKEKRSGAITVKKKGGE